MMWHAPAHDMLTSRIRVASLLIGLMAGNLSPKLSLWVCFDGGLRTISTEKVLVHCEIGWMHPD